MSFAVYLNLPNKLCQIYKLLSPKIETQAKSLILVTLGCSVMEFATVSIVAPMISMWLNPNGIEINLFLTEGLAFFNIRTPNEISTFVIIIFIIVTIVGGGLRIMLIGISASLASNAGAELAEKAFQKILNQKYEYLIGRNSSAFISILTEKIGTATGLILSLLSLFNAVLMLLFIWVALIYIDSKVTILTTTFFILLYTVIIYITRRRIDLNSNLLAIESPRFLKNLRETFGAVRDIILSGTQIVYTNSFAILSRKIKSVNAENIMVSQSPRYVVEMIALTIVALIAHLLQSEGMNHSLPLMGALVIGAQRMLPMVQIIYSAYVNIRVSRDSLNDVLEVMRLTEPDKAIVKVALIRESLINIRFKDVWFRYSNESSWVIKALELNLTPSTHLAVIGPSGAGKSTFLDLLTGLIEPVKGQIMVNGVPIDHNNLVTWRERISYVPQSVFLIDATIAENVAFSLDKKQIDIELLRQACQLAEIAEFIESRPNSYFATVGEGGVLLSGGQRQRIGIARAIYRNPDILILDEATNALDINTEKKVLHNLRSYKQNITIVHVTHRIGVTREFESILEFGENNEVIQGGFEELLQKSKSFKQMYANYRTSTLA